MNFLNLQILWHLLWAIPLILFIIYYAGRKRSRLLSIILGARQNDPQYVILSKGRRNLRVMIFAVALLFLFLAAARPYWGTSIVPFVGKGRDLLIVLDVSKSMLSKDIQPSRLEHAKWFIRQLLKESSGNRYGLIAFAGTAFLECPLTSDKTSFMQILNEMKTDSIPLGGTNVQKALETALVAFRAAESGHRAIVLISDGDELYGNSSAVIEKLKQSKIPLFVVGIGDPSQPGLISVALEDGKTSFMRDSKGELVKSQLNEKQLSALAMQTGGIYVRSTTTDPGLSQIEGRIKSLVPKDFGNGKHTRPIERFTIPLLIALLLLLLWMSISERKTYQDLNVKAGSLRGIILFLLAFSVSGSLTSPLYGQAGNAGIGPLRKNLKQPEQQLNQPSPGQPEEAAPHEAGKAVISDKEINDATALYNKAVETQKSNAPGASSLYEQAINLSADKPAVRSNSYQNLGVMKHLNSRASLKNAVVTVKKQDLDGALKIIDTALKGLDATEEMYVQAMSIPRDTAEPVKNTDTVDELKLNQQKLLNDRDKAEKLKKMIEELKKKQKEAQDKTKQAQQQQQKENQQQKQDQKQNKQDKQQQQNQQNKQQQKQDKQQQEQKQDKQQDKQKQDNKQDKQDKQQEQQQNQQQQKDAKQSREEAQKAVNDLKNQAEKLKQENMKKSAEAAEQELDKAEEAQNKKQGKKAEEHLKKALEKLGKPENDKKDDKKDDGKEKNDNKSDNKNQKDNQVDKNKENKDNKKGDKDEKQDKKLPQQQQAKAMPQDKGKDEKDIDPSQARAILDLMANDEKNLRDAIKERQKEAYGVKGVEKDW
ncbi:MAG: hypothetical protein A2017_12210 [Lentisphaerae bacterium GWF2_44_16]|nr:MAG: hypothetical protein A2017_12210 [Lentisphaerae bacterium GWF2_44_16]